MAHAGGGPPSRDAAAAWEDAWEKRYDETREFHERGMLTVPVEQKDVAVSYEVPSHAGEAPRAEEVVWFLLHGLRCTRRVGRPIAIASIVLIMGFLTMTFSEFGTLREFGFLAAFTMAVCFLTDLVLLPAVLIRLRL